MLSVVKIKSVLTRLINAKRKINMATNDLITVDTNEGVIRGKEIYASSFSKKKYFAFKGIPYAQPPVGLLRFRDPVPVEPWTDILDTLQEAPSCPQKHVLLKEVIGEENNCLALNVYTPQLTIGPGTAKPVMVWIHGGGFTFGSGNTDLHDPDYWMEKDVVIVTCNYRVGALGFLSLGTPLVPGNAGLKDQVAVLRWVQRNIAQFGGDPNNVTLFGESAGAASVHCHLLSPMSRGLFHRAILMSGCSLNSWAFSEKAVERSMLLGEKLGCSTDDPHKLLHFLQNIPQFDIVKNQNRVVTKQDKQDNRVFPFTPCVEPPSDKEGDRFLTEHPRTLLQRGQVAPVPLIVGINDKEGMLILNDIPHTDQYLKVINDNFARIVPGDLGLPPHAVDQITQFFFANKKVDWNNISQYLDYCGDLFFYLGIDEMLWLHLSCAVAPVYCYNLTFDGRLGFLSWFLRQIYPQYNLKGVCHADDVGYIFKYNVPGPPQLAELGPGCAEERFISRITGLWSHFASTGNPNMPGLEVTWEPALREHTAWHGYLELSDQPAMRANRLMQDRMVFWDTLMRPQPVLQQKL